jgi:zinc D-Ala-D-Ala carboxypeptidase
VSELLSPNLTLAEVVASDTAKRLGIKNAPTAKHLANLRELATHIFEPLRAHFGVPIYVSSGYRSAALNAATPGASASSQHSLGEALDLDQDGRGTGVTNGQIFAFIRATLPFDQLIYEFGDNTNPDWVHVSYRAGRLRGEVLRARRVKGKAIYSPMGP